MDGNFYLAKEKKFQLHHTSLSGGQAVDSAGTFTVKKGRLSNISLVSGHYKPKIEHGMNCLQALDKFGGIFLIF